LAAVGIAGLVSPWTVLQIIAVFPLAFAFYIMASFFLPWRLPPVYDRRVADEKRDTKRAVVLRRLDELNAKDAPAEAPEDRRARIVRSPVVAAITVTAWSQRRR